MTEERTIAVGSHGRYLVATPAHASRGLRRALPYWPAFMAMPRMRRVHLERLRSIPGSDRWLIVSIQGLHGFIEAGRAMW